MSMFEVNKVVGSGSAQEFLCQTINLGANVSEVKEIRKTVIIDNCKVVYDKVIIDGRLRKDIIAVCASQALPIPGSVRGCTGITTQVNGTLNDVMVEIAFNALIPVEGAKPGDECVVLHAFVEGEKEEPANIDRETGTFTALVDKTIIFLCVKVIVSKSPSVGSPVDDLPISRFFAGCTPKHMKSDLLPAGMLYSSHQLFSILEYDVTLSAHIHKGGQVGNVTVCVGLKLPWPDGVTGWGPGVHGPEMAALACDSRLTETKTGQWWDRGEKLFQVCANVVYTYAHSTWVGEGLMRALLTARSSEFGRLTPDLWLTNPLDMLQNSLRYVHQRALRKDGLSPEAARVYILAAWAEEQRVRLVRFDTGTPGAPYEPFELKAGVYAIGDIRPLTEARQACEASIRNDNRYEDNPLFWGGKVVAAVDQVSSKQSYRTVGGLVQGVVVVPGYNLPHGNGNLHFLGHARLEWDAETGNMKPTITTEIQDGRWVELRDGEKIGETRGHLPFLDFPSPVDTPPEEGQVRLSMVKDLTPPEFTYWVTERVRQVLIDYGWAVSPALETGNPTILLAVKGDQKWHVEVRGTLDRMEPEVTMDDRKRVVHNAVGSNATPVLALYWFHEPNGNRLFRQAGDFYPVLDPAQ